MEEPRPLPWLEEGPVGVTRKPRIQCSRKFVTELAKRAASTNTGTLRGALEGEGKAVT